MMAKPVAAVDTSLQDVLDAGKLVVGIEAAYPPFEDRDPDTDEIIGFDPDIAAIIGADLGVDIEFVDVSWDVIFTSLASGAFDCVISAVTITEDRELTMDFTRWYYKSEQAVMVTIANPKDITSIDDVNSSAIRVGVQAGTTSDLYLEDTNAEVVAQEAITTAVETLNSNTVDCVLGDHATLLAAMKVHPDTFKIVDLFSPEDFGIPCQDGSTSLVNRINEILDGLLGENLTGPVPTKEYNDIYYEWFEMDSIGYVEEDVSIPGYNLLALVMVVPLGIGLGIRKYRK
ncbi:MAG: transporter substrate-binding domain-containing protein [Promethearchaeota archaeon]